MKPGVSVGLIYWGAVMLAFMPASNAGRDPYRVAKVIEKLETRARQLQIQYQCGFSLEWVDYGRAHREHGLWYLLRFDAYTLDGASLPAWELQTYAARFKGVVPIDKENLDFRGRPV